MVIKVTISDVDIHPVNHLGKEMRNTNKSLSKTIWQQRLVTYTQFLTLACYLFITATEINLLILYV